MYGNKIKLIDELMEHLNQSQGRDFKSLLDETREKDSNPLSGGKEKPKGIKIESVEVLGKKPRLGEMGDEEPDEMNEKKSLLPKIGEEEGEPSELSEGLGPELSDEELRELIKRLA